ncbi:unnamed protein product [Blepharisma stoltei]|uniref:Ion transport domain-containing protein n=1 Tax=Blepharisma stoltei TaxID=1481888 RepID=A0AAU9IHP5_9CILI|nr:unnamed protein product [Blepharisma stoltei]
MVELTSEYMLFPEPKPSTFNSLLSLLKQRESKPHCVTIKTQNTPTCCVHYIDKNLFVGLSNGQVLSINLYNSYEEKRFSAHKLSIHTMAIDSSLQHLITGGKDKIIKEWDFDGNLLGIYPSTNFKVTALYCTNKYLLSGDTNGRFTVYDILTRKIVFSEICHKEKISTIAASSRFIASGGYDTLIRLRTMDNLSEIAVLTGHSKEIFNLCFTEDEKFLISVGGDSTVSVWSTFYKSISIVYSGHENWVRNCCISPDGRYIIAGTFDNSVRFWDLQGNDSEACGNFTAHDGTIVDICISSDGKNLFTVSLDKTLKIWNLYEQNEKIDKLTGHKEAVTDLVLSSDCLTLYSSSFDMTICIWSLSSEKYGLIGKLCGHEKGIRDLELSHNNYLLYSASEDGTVRIWDTNERKCSCILTSDEKMFFCVACNTNLLLAGGASGNITIWDIETRNKINVLVGHWNAVSNMALAKKSFTLYSCSYDKTIRIWDLYTMKQIKLINAHGDPVKKLSLSKSEKMLASGSCDGKVKIWDLDGSPIDTKLQGHNAYINSVLITNDENYAYSGSRDGDLIVWSIAERVELFRFKNQGHINAIIENPKTSRFIHSSSSRIFIRNLMFIERNFTVFPQKDSFLFLLYLKNLLKGKKVHFTSQWNDYIIFPWRVNVLHIYAYLNKWQDIKKAMKASCRFLIMDTGENPLSIALSRKAFRSADMIIKYLAKYYAPKNPYIFHSLEDIITILPKYNLSNTHLLFSAAFPEHHKKDLAVFGLVKKKNIILSKTRSIKCEALCKTGDDAGESVIFRASLCKFALNSGADDSISFLFCLMNCENTELFQTPLIQAILKYKFSQIKKFLWFQSIVSLIYLALLISYTLFNMYEINHIFILFIFNTWYLVYELLQVYQLCFTYFGDIWNVLDLLKVSTLYICLGLSLGHADSKDLQWPFTYAIFFSLMRSIAIFRMFDRTRYMIRMIIEIIKDISSFLLILLMATLAAGYSFYFSSDSDTTLNHTLLNILLVNFGQFFLEEATWLEWSMFVFALFLNPLILMNLLIAMMGDTFERVQYSMLTANAKEVASLVLEMEAGLLWKRKNNQKKYIQQCIQRDGADDLSSALWEGRVRTIRKNLKKLVEYTKSNQHKLDDILEHIKTLETASSEIAPNKLSSECSRFKYKDLKNRILI